VNTLLKKLLQKNPEKTNGYIIQKRTRELMLTPEKVFRPGKLPIEPGNVYASRGEAERKFKKTIRRGLIPLVYGEYGVGKTSMVRKVIRDNYGDENLVNIASASGKSISDIFSHCLEAIGYEVETKITSSARGSQSKEEGGSAQAGITWLKATLFSKKKSSEESGKTVEKEIVVTSPTDSKIIEVCEKNNIILVIDELHQASHDFIDNLTSFIKSYGNSNCDKFKIILLGTSSDSSRLVQKDPGIDRLIEDHHLKSMDIGEIETLIKEGMGSLQLKTENDAEQKLKNVCVGSPNILQYLCLEASDEAFYREDKTLKISDIDNAIDTYVNSKAPRLYTYYKKAIESTGKKKYRKQILMALSSIEEEYATMSQICEKVSENIGSKVRSTDLSGPLKKLKESSFGPILRDVEKPDGSGRVHNYTTFIDPAMKAFIRMQALRG